MSLVAVALPTARQKHLQMKARMSPSSPPTSTKNFQRCRTQRWCSECLKLEGLGVALAHDTVANHLIQSGRLVRPLPFALPMKEAYYLIAPQGGPPHAAAEAFRGWVLREMAA